MKARLTGRDLQKIAALIILSVTLYLTLAHGGPILKFFWAAFAFMIVNFWANDKKPDTWFFFLPWIISVILMIVFVVRLAIFGANYLIELISAQPLSYHGAFWHTNTGWPSLLLAFIFVLYGCFLLDNNVRTDFKNRLDSLFYF